MLPNRALEPTAFGGGSPPIPLCAMSAIQWLEEHAPGFSELTCAERGAVLEFTLLWTLFEARVLDENGSVGQIASLIDRALESGSLDVSAFSAELDYFRDRYFPGGEESHHFQGLRLRANDNAELVKEVLDGSRTDSKDVVLALFIIIYRFRNNLFHGAKWAYSLRGQQENLESACGVLICGINQLRAVSSPH